jgi:CPA2 family monovalent cation:H+ antiporter-2
MAMAVASTVVLIRVLSDNGRLETPAGHTAVGWLIVEDILTVVLLVLIPALAATGEPGNAAAGAVTAAGLGKALGVALLKLVVLAGIVLIVGAKVVPWVMVRVARLRSRELFTLTVLVMALAVATGSAYGFGVSMALGAFLAGMVVAQSPVSQQAAADALPFRDAFAVLFFVSVGMLFDPASVLRDPLLVLAALGIILIAKPLAAFCIVAMIGRPARTALVAALGLAHIGEFSFILSDLARRHGLLDEKAHNVLVAGALVSITLNPIVFRGLEPLEGLLQRWPSLWRWLNRAQRREGLMNEPAHDVLEHAVEPVAVILGYGPSGQAVDAILRDGGVKTVIVDLNMDTVQQLTRQGRAAIYGDGSNIEVMCQALPSATHLMITLPPAVNRAPLIAAAKLINPEIKIFVRAHYLREREELTQAGADAACFEEAEIAVALARLVLSDRGADKEVIRRETERIRQSLQAESPHLRS